MIKPVTFKCDEAIHREFKARCAMMDNTSVSSRLQELMSYDNQGDIYQTKKLESAFIQLEESIKNLQEVFIEVTPDSAKKDSEDSF